jgi:hypothetical protein
MYMFLSAGAEYCTIWLTSCKKMPERKAVNTVNLPLRDAGAELLASFSLIGPN